MKKIIVKEHEGKFLLIGGDGYSTTARRWGRKEQAEKARAREQKLLDEGRPSWMRWEY